MAGLGQVKKEIAQAAEAPKRSFERRRGNQRGKGTSGKGKSQPLWKKIILGCLIGASVIVVGSWAVFTIKPTWFASLKGRVEDRSPSPIVKKQKNPAPQHPRLAARTAKTRIVTTSAPATSTLQQPKERIATTMERPQVRIPEQTTQPQDTTPPPLSPQVTTPPSLSPKVEENVLDDYLEIGALYAQKGKFDKAEELFQKVAKEDPSSAKAHNNLGFVYLKQEKYELAEKEFKEALSLDSASVLPYYNLACLYSRKGMEVEALIYLKRALKRDARVKVWAMIDEDFDGLRSDVVFQELVGVSHSTTVGTRKQDLIRERENNQQQNVIRRQGVVQTQEETQNEESTRELEMIQPKEEAQTPEEAQTLEGIQAPEEVQTPEETPVPEEVQTPEEAQRDTSQ